MKYILKYLKAIYLFLFTIFIVLTFIEVKNYFTSYSNIFGFLYITTSLLIVYLFYNLINNFKLKNHKYRIKKNIIIFIIGLLSILLLPNIVNGISYIDNSNIFIEKSYKIIFVLKPIIYAILFIISFIEYYFLKLRLSKNQ